MSESKKALIVIDVQEGMFCEPGMKLYDEEGVMNRIQAVLERARRSGIPVIYIQHTEDEGEYLRGTPTWEISARIKPQPGEAIIEKSTWDAFHKTCLQAELESRGITDLTIVGMQSEFCLDTTCRRAFSLGYRSVLVQDAHSTFDSDSLSGEEIVRHHNRVLGGRFVSLSPADEVVF
ncbi:cysteine hydrolase [Paenibacillus sp. HN-1]|uniref:cysteine hydrolase family protein n=1 Tax=Paenibacillus TaxID=44249 RepID=UPI001CA83CBA|nr:MULTISPECIES: cysteine hydrolase family protein [Paenibacillus]MBY9078485.1 cysteine hydrolase [Paenibacillus sp. CGMCC 1.18879]MBY9082778.1 cysteine hydrolase [Paenibacillus sinensis]